MEAASALRMKWCNALLRRLTLRPALVAAYTLVHQLDARVPSTLGFAHGFGIAAARVNQIQNVDAHAVWRGLLAFEKAKGKHCRQVTLKLLQDTEELRGMYIYALPTV